jgi:hypothetical protein
MKRWGGEVGVVLLLMTTSVEAAGLGVPGDAFLNTFSLWVVAAGFTVGLVGLAGWIASSMDYGQQLLAGSMGWITRGMFLGGGTVILGAMGLVGGAVLP